MIYFDAGATTAGKTRRRGSGPWPGGITMSSPGRGLSAPAWPGRRPYLCRQEAAELLGFPSRKTSSITTSATHWPEHCHSVFAERDRVVISDMSTTPSPGLCSHPGLSVTVIEHAALPGGPGGGGIAGPSGRSQAVICTTFPTYSGHDSCR